MKHTHRQTLSTVHIHRLAADMSVRRPRRLHSTVVMTTLLGSISLLVSTASSADVVALSADVVALSADSVILDADSIALSAVHVSVAVSVVSVPVPTNAGEDNYS